MNERVFWEVGCAGTLLWWIHTVTSTSIDRFFPERLLHGLFWFAVERQVEIISHIFDTCRNLLRGVFARCLSSWDCWGDIRFKRTDPARGQWTDVRTEAGVWKRGTLARGCRNGSRTARLITFQPNLPSDATTTIFPFTLYICCPLLIDASLCACYHSTTSKLATTVECGVTPWPKAYFHPSHDLRHSF